MRDTEDIIFDADSALLSQQRTLPDMVASELGLLREPFKCRFFSANGGGGHPPSQQLVFWYHPILQLFFTSPQTPFLGLFRRPCLDLYGPF